MRPPATGLQPRLRWRACGLRCHLPLQQPRTTTSWSTTRPCTWPDPRKIKWQTAPWAVQGIYVIADNASSKLYVGKADGAERILGRWRAYATDGHGVDFALRDAVHCNSLAPQGGTRSAFSGSSGPRHPRPRSTERSLTTKPPVSLRSTG